MWSHRSDAIFKQIRVAGVVEKHVGLGEFVKTNPWFPSLIAGMLNNRLRDPRPIKTKLDNLSNKEAKTIGEFFSTILLDRQVAEAAVDMLVNDYPALATFRKRHCFFLPMAITIGQRKLDEAPWGLAMKVGIGAVLGMLDVGTDINSIYSFAEEGERGFANACIAMVAISNAVQLVLVFIQAKKRGWKVVATEAIIVLSGFKPAVDAWRVVSGKKAEVDDAMDPMLELTASRVVEM